MPESMFFPLETIQPSQIISQYSEWIYFTLILVFFISLSGIALRKHFDKPYVKPLIISVGLMLTFGAFRFKDQLTTIFDSWGILGSILLVVMVATIPFGLCRGFGMAAGKAFYLAYILIYILSWVQFPSFYHALGEHNLGLINLGLLILFIFAIFKVVKVGKLLTFGARDLDRTSPVRPEIDHDIDMENQEKGLVAGATAKMTKLEARSVEDIAAALDKIIQTIETHRNQLPREERERISKFLERISKDEGIFKQNVLRLQHLFQRLRAVDAQHFRELKDRFEKSSGKEKKLLKEELGGEEEKLKIEQAVFELERKMTQALNAFNQYLRSAVEHIRVSPHPYDAIHPLAEARKVLSAIYEIIKETRQLEEKLASLATTERKLLRKERQTI